MGRTALAGVRALPEARDRMRARAALGPALWGFAEAIRSVAVRVERATLIFPFGSVAVELRTEKQGGISVTVAHPREHNRLTTAGCFLLMPRRARPQRGHVSDQTSALFRSLLRTERQAKSRFTVSMAAWPSSSTTPQGGWKRGSCSPCGERDARRQSGDRRQRAGDLRSETLKRPY
jgi:hypothetical protein